jgi:hypothetical protein
MPPATTAAAADAAAVAATRVTTDRHPGGEPNAPSTTTLTVVVVNDRPDSPTTDPHQLLLEAIHAHLETLDALLAAVDDHWVSEDFLYRFWHHSMKVYGLQDYTARIVAALVELAPDACALHPWFVEITTAGTGKTFALAHNKDWLVHTRPIVEAFFHARSMLAAAVKYGHELERAPQLLPSGWAMLLELYQIR